jgi:energy-coupling factor transport system permease protein
MRLLTPILPDRTSVLGRANPLAKLVAAFVLLLALFVSLDGVTAGIILVALLATLPVSGVGAGALLGRSRLLLLAALSVTVANVLLSPEQVGPTVLQLGPIRIGAETALNGLWLGLRLLAIALAGLLATATSDPVDVADALIQEWRVSPRFALGALAALRLLPSFAREWQIIGLARRARGVEAGSSPVAWVRLLGGRLLALLVGGIRRAARMAAAMESRGLGSRDCRTVARPQSMRQADWGWIAGSVALGAGAIATSVWLGTWRFLLG